MKSHPRRVLTMLSVLAAALVSTGVGFTSAAAVEAVPVGTIGDLQTASSTCAGTSAAPTTITLTADITAPAAEVVVGCHVVLDLAGHDLTVRNVVIVSGQALTVQDNGGGGTLTADASAVDHAAGIQTTGATITINGGTVTANGGQQGAGIGGGYEGAGGTTAINGGTVTATGGPFGAAIGGGRYGTTGGTTTITGGTVTANGGQQGAGIGGGYSGAGGTTTITGGTVTATGGASGAGIGGGIVGAGGTSTISGGTVTATGGSSAAGIGGGGQGGAGGTATISGGTVVATGGWSAVGAGQDSSVFGSLSVDGAVLRLPSGSLQIPDSAPGAEITIGPDGVIDGSAGPGATYATTTGTGQFDNGGRILLPTENVTGNGVDVFDRHYRVSFDTQGGSSAPAPVTVFADTFEHGGRDFPPDPTRVGWTFNGWNTAADGTGDPVTTNSTLPGTSTDGAAVQITAHAQWLPIPQITSIAPSSGPMEGGTQVVITGTHFAAASQVFFGLRYPAASYTVDSDTQITAIAPASATRVTRHIRVRSAAGTSPRVAADRFTYTGTPPQIITNVTPSSGPLAGGTQVVITGTGFTDVTRVIFGTNGPATSFSVDSDTQITAVSPASATPMTRRIRVRTPGGTSPNVPADRFTWH